MSLADLMRQDWDERARRDAFHYIASWRTNWDDASFFASGEEDWDRLVAPVLGRLDFDASGKTMLELGCGAGRMTRAFARRFGRVIAVDLSAEMLRRARSLLPEFVNIDWTQGNGSDLSSIPAGSIDFAFSYIVLQHMPNQPLALRYIAELFRVLRPGGAFLFQFNNLHASTMNLRGRVAWSAIDLVWSAGLVRASRALARGLGLPPELAGKSWRGASLDAAAVRATVAAAGGDIREWQGENTAMAWCGGIKKESTPA